MNVIEHYCDERGHVPFRAWFDSLKDAQAKARIAFRLAKVATGNLGDCKPCRDGVWELREDFGPGYRVYYARSGKTVLLLLCGGDKRGQNADIGRAVDYWKDYQRRNAK
ncbi:MAG: type II toxin-antitoxin system RelE/ParE family toxin [Gammaproteobacteria bacterium]